MAYEVAKFPSTLHLNKIKYEKNLVNGYGDEIDSMVLRFYAENGFGGYGYIYIVVLKFDKKPSYTSVNKYGDIPSAYDSDSGMAGSTLDNKTAIQAYKKIFNTNKSMPYD